MSKLNNLYRRVRRFEQLGATSHAWIIVLRMIEALAGSRGETFHEVRAQLERKIPLGARPDLDVIIEAAEWLQRSHQVLQATRNGWVSLRRQEKQQGRRTSTRQRTLLLFEARVDACHRARPRVGCWGWRARAGAPASWR